MMHKIKHIFESYPLHPILLALFPVGALLAANIDKTPLSHAITPALISLLGALTLWGVLYLMTSSYYASALSASWFVLLFFSYGYAFERMPATFQHRYVLSMWGILFIAGMFCAYRFKKLDKKMTYLANIMATVLVALSLGQIAVYKIKTYSTEPPLPDHIAAIDYGAITPLAILPDIYYIIVDAYASSWSFDEFFKSDISEFKSFLTGHGFYIVPQSTSNYSKTIYSLSSQLNMDYLDTLLVNPAFHSVESGDDEKLGQLIENNRLLHFMRNQGYRTIHVGSPWTPTLNNRYADENINLQPIPFESEFSLVLYNTTALETVTEAMKLLDHRKLQWKRIQYEINQLGRIASRPEPTYVFAHLEVPHDPYVFDADGTFLPRSVEDKRTEKENYVRQVHYLNMALTALIDRILQQSNTPPIIVVQSDHGSGITKDSDALKLAGPPRDFMLQEGMRNFSAILLPGKEHSILPPTLTPVNVFRIVLNEYFGTDLALLSNKNFFKVTDVPGFIDATDIVRYR